MRNPIDAVIGWINPGAGVRRAQQRKQLERAYEAASRKDPWRPRRAGASANADHQADAAILRAKSRSLRQNVAYINAGMNARTHHGVGTGITSQFTVPAMQDAWLEFVKQCDADGNSDLYGLQKLAWDTMDTDGELLFRIRPRRPTDGFKVPFQLQAMEVDWLDTNRTRNTANGNVVIEGIEYDVLGRKVNYWFWSQHPGDASLRTAFKLESKPVPAEQVIHLFSCDRPGQGRGFPRMASIIARTRDFSLYEDAERARKNLETRLGFVASASLDGLEQPDKTPGDSTDLGTLSSGGIVSLPPGLNLTAIEPKATGGYTDTAKLELHLIAAGAGFTYEHATGDMSESNFTQGRMRMLAFRREIEQVQWVTFIPKLLDRICAEFVKYGELANLWRPGTPWKVKHTTPRWEYIQPDQEVAADLKEIGSGLATISSKLRARGEDPNDVFAEWKADRDRLVADGTWEDMLFLTRGNLPTPGQPDPGAKP